MKIASMVLPNRQNKKDNIAMNIGDVLKILRIQRKMTQEQLALEADIATSNVSRIEKGLRQPSQKVLLKMAKALKTKPSTIYAACEHSVIDPSHFSEDEKAKPPSQFSGQLILNSETQVVFKLFNELTPANKVLLTELLKTLHRNQEKVER